MDFGHAMVGFLAQCHKHATLTNPLIMNDVSIEGIDLKQAEVQKQRITELAFAKFNAKIERYGTVHHDHEFWSTIFFDKLQKAEDGDLKMSLPNGCCTNTGCPVKVYYELLGLTCPRTS